MSDKVGNTIHEKALQCGYDDCGVISLSYIDEYGKRLMERIEMFPEDRAFNEFPLSFLKLKENYPWAKAVIICTEYYGKYRFPESLRGKYAKSYLLNSSAPGYPYRKGKEELEEWLRESGIRFAGGEIHAPGRILPLRQAAVAAGLGIIRKNNFFYGPKGSWYNLEGYLIDVPCEYINECNLKPCADSCNLCQKACKTGALVGPYALHPNLCLSFLTTFGEGKVPDGMNAGQFGSWIMGCDNCQDACPYNMKYDWNEGEEFPGLKEVTDLLAPERIITATDEELRKEVISRSDNHLRDNQTEVLRTSARRVLDYIQN